MYPKSLRRHNGGSRLLERCTVQWELAECDESIGSGTIDESMSWTYMRKTNINIWEAAITLPMKNPTATLLWNFLMITVPPTHNRSNTVDDHRLIKASVPPRDDIVYNAMKIWMMDMKRIKYLWCGRVDIYCGKAK